MKREIEQNLLDFGAKQSGELNARFIFPEDFVGFQGHFPGNKILPGVCQIQCVITMLEKCKGHDVILKEIISAKFLSPVLPLEELTCIGRNVEEDDGEMVLKASLSKGGKKISELKLRLEIK